LVGALRLLASTISGLPPATPFALEHPRASDKLGDNRDLHRRTSTDAGGPFCLFKLVIVTGVSPVAFA
jgi:hypothetical protein